MNETRAFYVYNNASEKIGVLTKTDLFNQYKFLGWCESIQSAAEGCGQREDVQMTDISIPTIVKIRCENKLLRIYS